MISKNYFHIRLLYFTNCYFAYQYHYIIIYSFTLHNDVIVFNQSMRRIFTNSRIGIIDLKILSYLFLFIFHTIKTSVNLRN